jgi:RimJ/RimL family protein N-acetyltransferase
MVGRYCRVEPIHERFAGDLHAANGGDPDGRLWTYMPYGPFATEDEYRHWVASSSASNDPLFHVVVDQESGRATGVAAYLRIQAESGSIEVGHIAFSPVLQRTRGATEAMFLMMARAFALGYRRYEWKCDVLNAPSRAAAQRLGFSFEGVFRQATVYKGRNRDTAWYAVIDREWPALEQAFTRWLDPANFDAAGRQHLRLSDLTGRLLAARG